jgi:hypothetical protein
LPAACCACHAVGRSRRHHCQRAELTARSDALVRARLHTGCAMIHPCVCVAGLYSSRQSRQLRPEACAPAAAPCRGHFGGGEPHPVNQGGGMQLRQGACRACSAWPGEMISRCMCDCCRPVWHALVAVLAELQGGTGFGYCRHPGALQAHARASPAPPTPWLMMGDSEKQKPPQGESSGGTMGGGQSCVTDQKTSEMMAYTWLSRGLYSSCYMDWRLCHFNW